MRNRPNRTWASADDLLKEWAEISAMARRPQAPGIGRRPAVGRLITAAAAALVVLAVVATTLLVRPLGVAGPPTPPPSHVAGGATPAASSQTPGVSFGPARPASWRVDPNAQIGPESTSIPLLVTEIECASGQSPEGRVLEPVIEYSTDAVVISISIYEDPGDCPSNPEYPLTVELGEPLRDRVLLGGGTDPPAYATPTQAALPPWQRAEARLRELTQRDCLESGENARAPLTDEQFEAAIAQAGGHGWSAVDGIWVGDQGEALFAFGTWEVLADGVDRAVVIRWAGHYPQALRLVTESRAGRPEVTIKTSETHVCGDPTWQGPLNPAPATPIGFQRPADAPYPDGLRTDLDDCLELEVAGLSDDSGISFEYKVIDFGYYDGDGVERRATIRFTDPVCREHPQIGWLIQHLIEVATEDTPAPLPTGRPGSE